MGHQDSPDYSLPCTRLGNPQCFPHTHSVPAHTVWEIGVTKLQVLAGTCWVMLSAQRMLHLLNFQFQGIQRAKDFLHAVCIVHVVVGISIVHQLAGINVSPGPLGRLDGQRLDDFSRRTLIGGERRHNFALQWGRHRREMVKALHATHEIPVTVLRKTMATKAWPLSPTSLVIFPSVASPFIPCLPPQHL